MISDANLDFWIKNKYNVIFRGKHGVGKTATILEAFNRHNIKWQYFSASTMDPWVDFIGVPKEKIDENGNSYLDLVRPKHFQDDQVEAIFLDEFNRSSKKVRNAVMELIQFKSINGKKFNNLKIIWAAINPEDDEENKYDVEALDPAQLDRFHVIVDIPYAVHVPYFRKKYGALVGDAAATWWKELNKEQKDLVSPRRLDYAVDVYNKGGDLKFVLPNSVNTSKLLLELSSGSISKKLKELFEAKDTVQAKTFLSAENNYAASVSYFVKNKDYQSFFIPLLSDEKIIGLMSKNYDIEKLIFNNFTKYEDIISNLASAKSSPLSRRAEKLITKHKATLVKPGSNASANATLTASAPIYTAPSPPSDFVASYASHFYYDLALPAGRLSAYTWYENNLPNILDDKIAGIALNDLNKIAIASQVGATIQKKMINLEGMLNHVIRYYICNSKPMPKINVRYLSRKFKNLITE